MSTGIFSNSRLTMSAFSEEGTTAYFSTKLVAAARSPVAWMRRISSDRAVTAASVAA